MNYRRLITRSMSAVLTCCFLLELLPSTTFATLSEAFDEISISNSESSKHETLPVSGETDALSTNNTIVDNMNLNIQDYSKNAAYRTSGLTLDVFKKASQLHGGDNALSRELNSLNSGVNDDGLEKTEETDIRHLICSGYTYRQARAAIVTAEILGITMDVLCAYKEAELTPEAEISQDKSNLFLSNDVDTLSDDTMSSDLHNAAVKLGVPAGIVSTYAESSKLTLEELVTQVSGEMQIKYGVANADAVPNKSESTTTAASSTASGTTYTPDQVLDNPYDYKNYGNLDVNLSSGSYRYTETDLSIPGINGLDLNFVRIFDSAFSYSEYPRGFTSGYSTNEYTLRVSFDIYVAYPGGNYTLVSDIADYEEVEPEVLDLLDLNQDFKTSEYEDAVEYRAALASHPNINGAIWGAYDEDGNLVYMQIHPTLKAIGMFEDAFDNLSQPYNYLVNEFGLGHGWRLGFSYIERYYAGFNNGYKYRLILSDGRIYPLSSTFSIISDLDDLTLTASVSQVDYEGAKYKLTHADGKREYFDTNGRNIAILDRYNNKITLEYEYDDPDTKKVVKQIKITDTLGNIIIYKKESLSLGEDDYFTIDGLSTGRSMHNSKWTLSLNGSIIRMYYSYKDPDVTEWPRKLQVVENELSEYTLYVTSISSTDYNSFVMVPTTNDGSFYYASLNYIRYANDLKLDLLANSSRTDRELLGDGGYKETFHFGGTVSIAELDSGNIRKDYTKLEIGDSSGYYVMPEEDLEYCTTETIYRNAPNGPTGSGTVIWKSKVIEYYFDAEHHLVEEVVNTHKTVQEHKYESSTSSDRALLGKAFRTTYTYDSSPLPETSTLWTYEPGNSSNYLAANYRYTYDDKGNITEEILPNGNTIKYTYSPGYNILLSKTYNQDADTVIVEQNTLTSDNKAIAQTVVTSNGDLSAKTTYTYDTLGRMTGCNTYTSASNYTAQTFSYGSNANPTQISVSGVTTADGAAATATPGYTAGTILEKTSYNVRGWPISYTDGNGNVTTITYDAVGRITQVLYPNGGKDKYEYDVEAGTVTHTDPNNNTATYQYDYFGNLTSITDNTSGSTLVTYDYDSLNNRNLEIIHSSVDGNDQSAYTYYDNLGRIIETGIRNADDSDTALETYVYSAGLGKTTHTLIGSDTAPSQISTSYVDKMGNTVKTGRMHNNMEYVDTYTYDYLGNCAKYISAYMASLGSNYSTRYTYDHAGNVLTETDALGNIKTYTYDWANNLIQFKDAKNNISTNTYDKLGRLVKTSSPIDTNHNNVVKYYYDGAGNVTKQLTSTGTAHTNGTPTNYDSVLYTYDSMNRLTAVETPISSSTTDFTTYVYDLAGNIVQMNAGGRKNGSTITSTPSTTTYTYDQFGNVLSETNALNKTERYTYDLNGAILSKTDRNGIQTRYLYDHVGNLREKAVGTSLIYSYDYALNGALIYEEVNGDEIRYEYDDLGRTTQEYGANYSKYVAYNIGNLRTLLDCAGLHITYTYDVLGRLTGVAANGNQVTAEYEYDNNSNLSEVVYGNRVRQEYYYNSGNLVDTILTHSNNNMLFSHQYNYDFAGRMIDYDSSTRRHASYQYDSTGRIIQEIGNTSTNDFCDKSYSYDSHGNRTILDAQNSTCYTHTNYTYNGANQLRHSIEFNDGEPELALNYFYNSNGSLIETRDVTADYAGEPVEDNEYLSTYYTYNADNQLTRISGQDISAVYTYYPNGLRKTKTVGGQTTTYIWDGDQLIAETGANNRRYIRGLSLIASVGSEFRYYLHDAHGNVVALTDSSGSITRTYEYDAFGNQLNIDPTDTNPFRYCGEYYDAETGSYYLRARYYDSSIGRFTQEDPHWNTGNMVYGDDPASMSRGLLDLEAEYYLPSVLAMRQSGNLYLYCANNPVFYVDPNGNFIIVAKLVNSGLSAVKGGIIGGITYYINGRSILEGATNGAVSGAVEGLLSTALSPTLQKALSSAVGAGIGALVVELAFYNRKFDEDLFHTVTKAMAFDLMLNIPNMYWAKATKLAADPESIANSIAKSVPGAKEYTVEYAKFLRMFFDSVVEAIGGAV